MSRPMTDIVHLAETDGRYTPTAFELVWKALQFTTEEVKKGNIKPIVPFPGDRSVEGTDRFHVTGRELLAGFRQYVRTTYGNLSLLLLERCGIHRTEDVGEIVFCMVEAGMMGKRDSDSRSDFAGGYDFAEAFDPHRFIED